MEKKELGKLGENTAAEFLQAKGYSIICRNFRCPFGEIDIIAEKNGTLSFVEVKTRSGLNFGSPGESITRSKKDHLQRTARYFLQRRSTRNMDVRLDVIEVYINHLQGIY